jgi:beta-lactamase class D
MNTAHQASIKTVLFTVLLFLPVSLLAQEDADLRRAAKALGVKATVVIESLDGSTRYLFNHARAATRYSPASTFKIPNTLIALETGAIGGADDSIRWDGITRSIDNWNKDQSLRTAFQVSCVWFYQELARRVGFPPYERFLHAMKYGNRVTGDSLTLFWLNDALKISALEQIRVLRGIVREEFPFRKDAYATLKSIMVAEEKKDSYILYGKTGWSVRLSQQIGWYVGYVETPTGVWLFAVNLDVRSEADLPLRKQLAVDALKAKGIL